MANDSDRIAELTAQLQHQQRTARFRFGFLLVLMAGLDHLAQAGGATGTARHHR
jgi:hypothetical protein